MNEEMTTQNLLALLEEEEKSINTDIQAHAIELCGVLAESFLDWQKKSPTIRDLSFTGADIIHQSCGPLYQFLSAEDQVPLKVKVQLCRTALSCISISYFETSHKRVSEDRVAARRPISHWDQRRWKVRFQAHDLVLSQFPLLHQSLALMGYTHYSQHTVTLSSMKSD